MSAANSADRDEPPTEDPVPPAAKAAEASEPSTATPMAATMAEASEAVILHPLTPAASRLALDCAIEVEDVAVVVQSEL